jgi:hypothetical protein
MRDIELWSDEKRMRDEMSLRIEQEMRRNRLVDCSRTEDQNGGSIGWKERGSKDTF